MLLGPSGILIFLAPFGGIIGPTFGRFTGFNRHIFIPAVVLCGNRDDGGVNDLTSHRQIALGFQVAVKIFEQHFDDAHLGKLISV